MQHKPVSVTVVAAVVAVASAGVISDKTATAPVLSPQDQQLLELLKPGWEEGWEGQEFAPYDPDVPQRDIRDDVNYYLWTR